MDMWIVDHITVVVVVDEWMLIDGVVYNQSGCDYQKTDNDVSLLWGREESYGLLSCGICGGGRQRMDLITGTGRRQKDWDAGHLARHLKRGGLLLRHDEIISVFDI